MGKPKGIPNIGCLIAIIACFVVIAVFVLQLPDAPLETSAKYYCGWSGECRPSNFLATHSKEVTFCERDLGIANASNIADWHQCMKLWEFND